MHYFKYYSRNYLSLISSDKHIKILDFGCANGNFLKFLQSKGYTDLNGADIYADNDWKDLNELNILTTKFDDTEAYLHSISGTYDLIIVKDVIYYFKDDEVVKIIELLKAALKPTGKILFEIVNGAVLTGPYVKYKDYRIKLILTEQSIAELIKDAGMQVMYLGGNKTPLTGVRSFLFIPLNALWKLVLRLIYFAERGADDQNPRFLSRKIIVIAGQN